MQTCVVFVLCLLLVGTCSDKLPVTTSGGNQGKRDAYSGLDEQYLEDFQGHGVSNNLEAGAYEGQAHLTQQQISQIIDEIYNKHEIKGFNAHKEEHVPYAYDSKVTLQHATHTPPTLPFAYPVSFTKQIPIATKPQYAVPLHLDKGLSSGSHNNYFLPQTLQYEGATDYDAIKGHQLPVPYPIPVPVEKHVPIEKPVPYPVPVKAPYPVSVPQPYPVPVEKPIPYPVVKPIPYPVHYPVPLEHYHSGDAFKINQETFGFGNYHGLHGYHYQAPFLQKPEQSLSHSYQIPNFGQFALQFEVKAGGNNTISSGTSNQQSKKNTTTTSKPTTTTKRPDPKVSLLSFLLKNLSSS